MWSVYVHIFPNQKYYVGITSKKPELRWGHKGNNYCRQTYLYNAIQKYGWDNIEHDIIASNLTEDEAKKFEMVLIDKLDCKYPNGYNLTSGGDGVKGFGCFGEKNGMYGKIHSEETKQKISSSRKNKLVGSENPFYGKHHSEESKEKISKNNKGKKTSKEVVQKIAEKNMKKVCQINTTTNEIINIYNSIKEAAELLNLDRGSISKCCNGKRKSVGGFKWEFLNEQLD